MNRPVATRWPILALALALALQACKGDDSEDPNATSDHLAKGTAALETALTTQASDDFLEAANEFSAAAGLVGRGAPASQADRDRARFFGALARVALLADPYSDLTANGLNDVGDILDAFGVATDRAARATFDESLFLDCTVINEPPPIGPPSPGQLVGEPVPGVPGEPGGAGVGCELKPFPEGSPRSGELQAFLADRVAAELRAAVALLEDVSDDFVFQLHDGPRLVEIDKTDALFLTAAAQGMLATLDLLGAYDLDVDLRQLRADAEAGAYTIQDFATDHPLFLTLREAERARVPQARVDATDGIRSLQAALQHLTAETDDPSDDLIRIAESTCTTTFDPNTGYSYSCTTVYNPEQQIADFQDALAQALAVATAPGEYTFDMNTPDDLSDDVVVDPGKFFAGLDLRALAPASFNAGALGDRPSVFPDSTFGGVLVSAPDDPNADLDGDGSPDIFGYTYFGSYLNGRSVSGGYGPYSSPVYGSFALAPDGSGFVFTDWTRWDPISGYATVTGTFSYATNVLTLAFDAPLPNGVATVIVTGERIDGSSFEGMTRFLDDAAGELPGSGYLFFYY